MLAIVFASFLAFVGTAVFRVVRGRRLQKAKAERQHLRTDQSDHDLLVQVTDLVAGREQTDLERIMGKEPPPGMAQQVEDLGSSLAHLHECFENHKKDVVTRLTALEKKGVSA